MSRSGFKLRSLIGGLRFRVGVILIVCVGAFAAAVVARSGAELEAAYDDQGRLQALALARGFSAELSRADLRDPGPLRDRLVRLRNNNPELQAAAVFAVGRSGPVASTGLDVTTSDGLPAEMRVHAGRYEYAERDERGAHFGDLVFPVLDGRGAIAGSVWLSLDLSSLDSALAGRQRTLGLQSAALALALALLVIGLVGRTVVAPLGLIGAATKRIRQGELSTRLHWRRQDEIGTLAHDFDEMADELEETHDRLETQALTDHLTGLMNHRAFQERLQTDLSRAARERYSVTLIAFDIDSFKGINDRWGHAVGDDALRRVAGAAEANLRSGDVCGRIGGDEFVIALSHAGVDEGEQVVGRLRSAVSALRFGPEDEPLTVSAGIAEFPRHAQDQAELMRLADGAMYWAKRSGRDGWFTYSTGFDGALSPTEDAERARIAAEQARDHSLATTVHALAHAVDAKDPYTHEHSQRVGRYAAALAKSLGLEPDRVAMLHTAGVLHDVGKIGIADAILLKPGELTGAETVEMRRHATLGRDIVAGAGMPEVGAWIGHMHERMDGKGYPDGLAGEAVPLESRILHAADALEAMISPRVYRGALGVEGALARLRRGSGTQFDPEVVSRLFTLVSSGELEVERPGGVAAANEVAIGSLGADAISIDY